MAVSHRYSTLPKNLTVQFPTMVLDIERSYIVQLAHANTPEDFYVTMPEREIDCCNLKEEVNRVYYDLMKEKNLPKWTRPMNQGECCIFQIGGSSFFRGLIHSIKERNKVDVIDIDLGELITDVSTTCVYPVNNNSIIRKTPMFAVHCKLRNIAPPNPGVNQWNEEIVDAFVSNYSVVHLTCVITDIEDDIYVTNLMKKNGREVADHMMAMGLARRPKRIIYSSGYPTLDIHATIGDRMEVIVSYVESPWNFFVQLKCNADLISKVCREVNYEYLTNGDKYGKAQPIKGHYCAAKYEMDGHWYRAKITARLSPTRLEVQFVDFGNKSKLSTSDVKELKSEYVRYPGQAVECGLRGVAKIGIFINELDELQIENRDNLHAEIHNVENNVLTVTLYQKIGRRMINLNDIVLGKKTPNTLLPRPVDQMIEKENAMAEIEDFELMVREAENRNRRGGFSGPPNRGGGGRY